MSRHHLILSVFFLILVSCYSSDRDNPFDPIRTPPVDLLDADFDDVSQTATLGWTVYHGMEPFQRYEIQRKEPGEEPSIAGTVGTVGKWAFLVGAWGAIFSSMLGVWQSVPYLFADFWGLMRNPRGGGARQVVDTRSLPYRAYLYALATIPAIGLLTSFAQAQKYYAVFGALFIPMLAVALLVMNGRAKWVGDRHANSRVVSCVLVGAVALFALFLWFKIAKLIG